VNIHKTKMVPIKSSKNSLKSPLEFSSANLQNAFDRHLYISSKSDILLSILCYDGVLCYLSNVIGQGSLNEIDLNLKRYFSIEQINQAYFHLHDCLDYILSILDANKDHSTHNFFHQCSIDLIDSTSLLAIMETIYSNKLFSYLPIFVTHDWIHMIRSVQNLEKLDKTSSYVFHLRDEMLNLKEHLTALHHLVRNFNHFPVTMQSPPLIPNDQCCLRTYCAHNPSMYCSPLSADSSVSSSWSSLDIDINPIITTVSGFIRNPVSSFLIPTAPAITARKASIFSTDDRISSDDEQDIPSSSILNRSLSFQPSSRKTGSIVVKRNDSIWIYPAAVIKPKYNALFSSVHENTDQDKLEPRFTRANSCDNDFPTKKFPKPKAPLIKQPKGLKI
jgi:hypothetical protein